MSTASLKQGKQLLELFSGATTEAVQNIIEAGDLLLMMLSADLARVDRQAFVALLTTPTASGLDRFTPVDQLVDKIMARSDLRNWGFTDEHAQALREQLAGREHAGPLAPVGVTIWRGVGNLAYNWAESLAWWSDEMKAIGLNPVDYLSELEPELYPNRESSLRPMLQACSLDFQTFWDPKNGLVPRDVRQAHPMRKWPALEVIDFLALNSHYAALMDGKNYPFLMAVGLVVDSDSVPYFSPDGREVYANCYWGGNRWSGTAAVAFRES